METIYDVSFNLSLIRIPIGIQLLGNFEVLKTNGNVILRNFDEEYLKCSIKKMKQKNYDTVAGTGEECLHLISTLPPPVLLFLEYQTTSLQYIIVSSSFFLYVVFFMCVSACRT